MSNTPISNSKALPVARNAAQREEAPRARETEVSGGPRLKLGVRGSIPGFTLFWENDDEGAVEQLLYEGFSFVEPEEVRMQSHIVSDADLSKRVSRYVGKKADGSPLRAYLLKCPDEVWKEREADRYRQADERDAAIRSGTIAGSEGRYRPKGYDLSVNTQFRKDY